MKRLLTPRWIVFHLIVVAAMVALVNLGLWQLRRLDERTSFNDLVSSHVALPTDASGEALTEGAALSEWEWRSIAVRGTFTAPHTIQVVNREQGGSTGNYLLDVLRTASGQRIVVNRGFLAAGAAAPAVPTEEVTVVGRIRRPEGRGLGQTADQPSTDLAQVRRVDLDVLAVPYPGIATSRYLDVLTIDGAVPPGIESVPLPALDDGPHLSYAVQWFIFTACAAIGWWFAVRRTLQPTGKRLRRAMVIDEERTAEFERRQDGNAPMS